MGRSRFSLEAILALKDNMTGPMMGSIRTINRTSDALRANTRDVTTSMRQSLQGATRGFNTLRAAAGLAVAAITAGRIARGVSEMASYGNEVAQMSRRLGLSAEALQELEFAGRSFGVQTDALRDGLKELSLRADEFAVTGAGGAAEAMRRLGLSQTEVAAHSHDTAALFELVRDRLEDVQNVAARQRLADEIFGGQGGEQLVEMASASADALNALRLQARDLGVVMSQDTVDASERFTRQLNLLKGVGRTVAQGALLPLMDSIIPVVQAIVDWTSANRELMQSKITGFFSELRDAAAIVARYWQNGLIPAVLAGVAAFNILVPAITGVIGAVQALKAMKAAGGIMSWLASGPIGLIIGAVVALGVGVYMLIRHWDKVRQWLAAFWQRWGDWIAGALAVFMPFIGIPVLIVQHWGTISTFFAGLWRTVSTGVAAFVGGVRDRFTQTVDRITETWAALTDRFTEIGNAIRDSIVGAFEGARDRVTEVWQSLIDWFTEIGNAIRDSIVGAFEGARDRVTEVWQSLIDWFTDKMAPITDLIDNTVGKFQDIGGNVRDRLSGLFDGGDDTPRGREFGGYASPGTSIAETRAFTEHRSRTDLWVHGSNGARVSRAPGSAPEPELAIGLQ